MLQISAAASINSTVMSIVAVAPGAKVPTTQVPVPAL